MSDKADNESRTIQVLAGFKGGFSLLLPSQHNRMPARTFNALVFTDNPEVGNKGYVTYHNQSSLVRFMQFVHKTHSEWKFIWFYPRHNKEQILVRKKLIQIELDRVIEALK